MLNEAANCNSVVEFTSDVVPTFVTQGPHDRINGNFPTAKLQRL
jgi:hypothetical protein